MVSIRTDRASRRIGAFIDGIAASLPDAMRAGVAKAGFITEGFIKDEIRSTFQPNTGALQRSFRFNFTTDDGRTVGGEVASDLVYAAIQNDGGVITPKVRKNLSIPVSPEAKRRWPREWPKGKLFMIVSKRMNRLLVERIGEGLKVHYVLKPSVKIRGRHYLEKAVKKAQPALAKALGEGISVGIRRATRG